MQPRDRIKTIRNVRASEIRTNDQNWRKHPTAQREEMTRLLATIGNVDVLKVVEQTDGTYLLVDGHLRKDILGTASVKVAVLDLDERETKEVLASFDKVGGLADEDEEALGRLLAELAAPPPISELEREEVLDLADAIRDERPWTPQDEDTAQAIASATAQHLRRVADENPTALREAYMIVLPTSGPAQALILADPDLEDIATELRLRHEQGETHPLDRLFEALWTPPK